MANERNVIDSVLSPTRIPDGACSVEENHRGVLDTRTNPDTCGRANSIRIRKMSLDVKIFKSTEKKISGCECSGSLTP